MNLRKTNSKVTTFHLEEEIYTDLHPSGEVMNYSLWLRVLQEWWRIQQMKNDPVSYPRRDFYLQLLLQ